jgi:hypothetical protein
MKQPLIQISLCLLLFGGLTSCLSQTTDQLPTTEAHPTTLPSPTSDVPISPTPSQILTGQENPLPSSPLSVVFFSEDGIELQGKFFPAAALDRPVVVLMHWYQGDQGEWEEIAYWLQNRGGSGTRRGLPWLDPSWFPNLPPDTTYNVLTFNFRGCQGGCGQLTPQEWLQDARASLVAAQDLRGVNPNQIVAIGASIGGDAAISSCAFLLDQDPQSCLGALSISPGSYLGESYPDLVSQLENSSPPRPAWCFYDEDYPDSDVCKTTEGTLYNKEGWQGGSLHGMHLITETLDPLPLQRLADFLTMVTN